MTEASRSLQVTSEYWIEEVVGHGGGDFHILWRTIILGCCSVFRGAAAPGPPVSGGPWPPTPRAMSGSAPTRA